MTTTPNYGYEIHDETLSDKDNIDAANRNLLRTDAYFARRVLSRSLTEPPASPGLGDIYIPAAPATGDWLGKEDSILTFYGGVWLEAQPQPGPTWAVADEGDIHIGWNGAAWMLAASGSGVEDGDKGDIEVSDIGAVWTIKPEVIAAAVAAAQDPETLKADETKTITVGYELEVFDAGAKSSGAWQPAIADGAKQKVVNDGPFELTPPGVSCEMKLKITNGASAGAISTAAFSVDGDALTTTPGHKFELFISDWGDGDANLRIRAMQ